MDDTKNTPVFDTFHTLGTDPVTVKTLADAATQSPSAKSLLDDLTAVIDGTASVSADIAASAGATDAVVGANKARIIIKALRSIEQNIVNIIRLLEDEAPASVAALYDTDFSGATMERETELASVRPVDGRVVEGVFDGQNMVGSDGKIYTTPPNYASKSKLVEGDLLKLTITSRGSFIYKQIGPIERGRIVGELGFDPTIGEFYVTHEDKRWSVIKASVTYYKGEAGDEAVILVPKSAPSKWAAIENILKKNPL